MKPHDVGVREIVTVLFGVAICTIFAFTEKISGDQFVGIAGMVMAFWFGSGKKETNGSDVTVIPVIPTQPTEEKKP